ncbi:MAG: lipoate--protein ligase family protein [Akkermansiaceae bacterium]
MLFHEIELWFDPVARVGPEAMAVDQWLLETRETPMMRVYQWSGKWGSLGYFGSIEEANTSLPSREWVRRWTGGGIVDHCNDWTYSLVVPKKDSVAQMKGGESYGAIHRVLVDVLREEIETVALAPSHGEGGGLCFQNAVEYDVVGESDEKIAGAAQRRSKSGLLHQGSVAVAGDSRLRGKLFAEKLAGSWCEVQVSPEKERIEELVILRYGNESWLRRR